MLAKGSVDLFELEGLDLPLDLRFEAHRAAQVQAPAQPASNGAVLLAIGLLALEPGGAGELQLFGGKAIL